MTSEQYVKNKMAEKYCQKKKEKERRAMEILQELEDFRPKDVDINLWALAMVLANQEN